MEGPPELERGGKDSVVVCARFRPQNNIELDRGGEVKVQFPDPKSCIAQSEDKTDQLFTFDRVFPPGCEQREVYEYAARPIIDDIFNGYYATVFAYGQTGSGKTFTMEGVPQDEELKGIIPRAVEHLFKHISSITDSEFTVGVSYVEIYMEKIRDLLDKTKTKVNLDIRVDLQRGVYVESATEVVVAGYEEMTTLMEAGSNRRHVSATGMNEESSRSHAIFMITVNQKNLSDMTIKTGKLFLVDLAGSEMVSKTGAKDQRLEEAKQINKSLSALGNVIKALTDNKSTYVPYRDSKLTRILQDSLGGGARAALIIACSPSSYNIPETISTLRFGTRAKFIKNKLRMHVGYSGGSEMNEVLQQREEVIGKLQADMAGLIEELKRVKAENLVFGAVYGPVPQADMEGIQVDEGTGSVNVDHLPKVNMQERVQEAEEKCEKLTSEVESIAKEATLLRPAITDFEKHLLDERSLFGQLKADITKLYKRLVPDGAEAENPQAHEKFREVDKLLGMAKWKAESTLKKLKPLQRASQTVAAASAATAKHFAKFMPDARNGAASEAPAAA